MTQKYVPTSTLKKGNIFSFNPPSTNNRESFEVTDVDEELNRTYIRSRLNENVKSIKREENEMVLLLHEELPVLI